LNQPQSTVAMNTPVEQVVYQHMLNNQQRAVPVLAGDGTLLGLITLADVRRSQQSDWGHETASDIMTPTDQLTTVSPGESLSDALPLLAQNDYHQLPVVQNGKLVGLLTRSHVMQYLHLREQIGVQGVGGGPPAGQTTEPAGPEHRKAG
ncbi:MAG: CBS domain-containing protein, partial [Chloroflexota bacterium]